MPADPPVGIFSPQVEVSSITRRGKPISQRLFDAISGAAEKAFYAILEVETAAIEAMISDIVDHRVQKIASLAEQYDREGIDDGDRYEEGVWSR